MELVILVDEQNQEIGTFGKDAIHTADTPLHRGFSLFLFNQNKELLITQRALSKKTFPGLWTNTVCGHPSPHESVVDAAKRRLKHELGMTATLIKEVAPYRYRFTDKNGVVENEICPILVARSYAYPTPNHQEIADWRWIPWGVFVEEVKNIPQRYSPWCREEAEIITDKLPKLLGK